MHTLTLRRISLLCSSFLYVAFVIQDSHCTRPGSSEGNLETSQSPRLALVVRSYSGDERQLKGMLRNLATFVPADVERVVILDAESKADHDMGNQLTQDWEVNVFYETPPRVPFGFNGVEGRYWSPGYNRMLFSSFYFDRYTDADLIGLMDADSRLYTLLTPFDFALDSSGRVMARALPVDHFTEDAMALKMPQALVPRFDFMCGPDHFPMFFWRSTFHKVRNHIEEKWQLPFEAAFREFSSHRKRVLLAGGLPPGVNPINIIYNVALKLEPEKYTIRDGLDSAAVPTLSSGAQGRLAQNSDAAKEGCCNLFPIFEHQQCPKAAVSPLLQFGNSCTLMSAAAKHTAWENRQDVVDKHYVKARLYLEKLPEAHVERMREHCRELVSPGTLGTSNMTLSNKDVHIVVNHAAMSKERRDFQAASTRAAGLQVPRNTPKSKQAKVWATRRTETERKTKTGEVKTNTEEVKTKKEEVKTKEDLVKIMEIEKVKEIVMRTEVMTTKATERFRVLLACGIIVTIILVVWLFDAGFKESLSKASGWDALKCAMKLSLSSCCMHLLNKACADLTQAPATLSAIQMLIALGVMLSVHRHEVLSASWDQTKYWLLQTPFWIACLVSSMFSYEGATISIIVLFKNVTPLVSFFAEQAIMPAAHRPVISWRALACLILIPIGTALYCFEALQGPGITYAGIATVILNVTLVAIDQLLRRRLLVQECKCMTSSAGAVVNNAVGVILAILVAFLFQEPANYEYHASAWTSWSGLTLIAMSGLVGVSLGFTMIDCQRAMSTTSFQVLLNLNKTIAVAMSAAIFGDRLHSRSQFLGIALSLSASFAYACEKNQKASSDDKTPVHHQTPHSKHSFGCIGK